MKTNLPRTLSELTAVACITLVWYFLLPRIAGVSIADSLLMAMAVSAIYRLYETQVMRGIAALPLAISIVLLTAAELLLGKSPSSVGIGSKKASNQAKPAPYPVVLLVHALLRAFGAVMFLTILSVLLPRIFSVASPLSGILLSGAAIAFASWFSPLAMLAVLLVAGVVVLVPILLVLMVMDRTVRGSSKQESSTAGFAERLGRVAGFSIGLLLFPIMEIIRTFPSTVQAPPQEVPDDLSAKQYFDLGVQYKTVGWTEQARVALNRAIAQDPDSELGKKSLRYLRTKLPRRSVPSEAVQRNIEGFNQMSGGDKKGARQTFEHLIAEYPDFEWPYSNLAALYLEDKNAVKARELVEKALAINPDYVNALLRLAEVCKLENDEDGRRACIDRASELDPDDTVVALMKKAR